MAQHAYRLRSAYEQLHPDTTISLTDGTSYPVGRAFADAPDGVVVVDGGSAEQQALEHYFAVKTTALPQPQSKTSSGAGARKEA